MHRAGGLKSLLTLALVSLTFARCASAPKNENVVGTFSDRLSPYNYKEEGRLVRMVVGVEAARFVRDEPFVPLIVQVANKSKLTLQITRESFVLEDALGRTYSMAEGTEVAPKYGRLDLDRRLMLQNRSFTATGVSLFSYIESNFFPSTTRRALLIQQVTLPPTTYMEDLFYFPIPETGLNGVTLRLLFKPKQLEEPVMVVFQVPKTVGIMEKDKPKPGGAEPPH